MTLHIAALWRYPVKSLAGEAIEAAELTTNGIVGDRVVVVRGPEGIRTARRHYRLLGLKGTLRQDGTPLVNGLPWWSGAAQRLVRRAAGPDAWLDEWAGPERFDVLPLLVATDGAVLAFGREVRRLRPNLLVGGVTGMEEVAWPGGELHVSGAVIRLRSLRSRCVMTTVDPDTLERNPEVLRDIVRRFGGRLALDADVAQAGVVHVGEVVTLVVSVDPVSRSEWREPARGDSHCRSSCQA